MMGRLFGRSVIFALVALIVSLIPHSAGGAELERHGEGRPGSASMLEALAAQDTATATLLNDEGIVGIALSLDAARQPHVVVMLETSEYEFSVPDSVEGVATETVVTGVLHAFPCSTTTSDCSKPIPPGVSVGHPNITAGTLGAYVQDSQGDYFALSNNHIFANENAASIGDPVLQPGPADGGSVSNPSHILGPLDDFHPIAFCGGGSCNASSPTNPMDAAIVAVDTETVQAENFCGWTPQSTTLPENQVVVDVTQLKKCGRTSGFTTGTVVFKDAVVNVQYSSGSAARFDGQIVTTSMSSGGDSGSLMVDLQNRPTALLFAGSASFTIGSPIDDVLDRFGVSIVDADPPNQDPVASFTVSCTVLTCDFDASESDDPDGAITGYDWEFGDGNTGTGETVSHTYNSGGSQTVTLTVTDNDNATDTTSRTANPSNPPPPPPTPPPPLPPTATPLAPSLETCPDTLADPGFTDLDAISAEASHAVACLVAYEITEGTSSTTFSPLLSVTRWQMALFLTRQASVHGVPLPAAEQHGFTDIGGLSSTTQDAINQLATLGITKGTSETTFDPLADVTRWQMALFLTRMADLVGVPLPESPNGLFLDLGGLTLETQQAINQLAELGIAQGTSGTTFDPLADVLRWQMALFLTRLLEADGVLLE